MKGKVIERVHHDGDCYIVTGSIGPDFGPRLFREYRNAVKYAKEIADTPQFPPFTAVIEDRNERDMLGRLPFAD